MFLTWWLHHWNINKYNRWGALMVFLENIPSWACFWGSGLNNIFHWWAHLEIKSKSLFSWSDECLISWTVEKIELSSPKSFTDDKSLDRSFIWLRKSKGPNIDPCGTPANTGSHEEIWPFNSTLCNLFSKKFWSSFRDIPFMPKHFIL